ncbi:clip-associated protein [Cucumis melo var. makuwa]|uniref:Clip-associated protein n=1 Tax=Cucumis melo var. makuwa TaxID=1194695 RepID=A0A5A7T9S8_CUCMM|nr:clip-associated protein [Cucumis melo var. makuwa]TYK25927.1 clip-associated protein [Cucumis melo var. makuwa]
MFSVSSSVGSTLDGYQSPEEYDAFKDGLELRQRRNLRKEVGSPAKSPAPVQDSEPPRDQGMENPTESCTNNSISENDRTDVLLKNVEEKNSGDETEDPSSIAPIRNDTLLFGKYDEKMLLKLKDVIRLFKWCSGQKVNWEKSTLSSANVVEDDLVQTTNLLDQIDKKLDRWKRYNISRGGRHTSCNSILASLPTYYLSLFSIPENVAATLEKIMRNFFQEGYTGSTDGFM